LLISCMNTYQGIICVNFFVSVFPRAPSVIKLRRYGVPTSRTVK
jgi:hypothetical protein